MICLSHQDGSECDPRAREMVKAGESLALRPSIIPFSSQNRLNGTLAADSTLQASGAEMIVAIIATVARFTVPEQDMNDHLELNGYAVADFFRQTLHNNWQPSPNQTMNR